MFKLAEYTRQINDLAIESNELLKKAGKKLALSEKISRPIKLVFAGQYSAGKSTIIKMLTGDENIETGAGITTQTTNTYLWNGIEVVDTPGIHTQLRPDHDAISYQAIMSADMLVFVITNELFDEHLAEHFRKLAIDRDRAGEMLLVVNKMERTALGNISEQQQIIKEDLEKVLKPYTTEQLKTTFIDAESYLDSISEEDKEIADELFERSGYSVFVTALDQFVQDKSLLAPLTTTLYEMEGQLEDAISSLQPQSEDSDIDALEQNFLQQRHELFDSRNRLQQEIISIFIAAATQLRTLGMESSNLITSGSKQEVVEAQLQESVNKANDIIDDCQSQALRVLEERMNEINQAVESIEQSGFSRRLIARLEEKFDSLPENVKNVLSNASSMAQKAGNTIVKNAYNAEAQGGLRLANFSGGNVHNIVLKAGHAIGYKFKPWQAIKIAKGVAVAGQVLSVLGVGLSIFMQIKEDHDEEQHLKEINENRQNVRSQFYCAANELEEYGRLFVRDNVMEPLDYSIQTLDDNILKLRDTREDKNELCKEMEALLVRCQNLYKKIHASQSVENI